MPTFPDLFASRNEQVAWFGSGGELSLLSMNYYLDRYKSAWQTVFAVLLFAM